MKLPAYFVVGARPVKAVATAQGGMDILAYDWDSGELRRDMSYLSRLTLPDAEVESVTEEAFERRVAGLRAKTRP